jgi:hypothetical protein
MEAPPEGVPPTLPTASHRSRPEPNPDLTRKRFAHAPRSNYLLPGGQWRSAAPGTLRPPLGTDPHAIRPQAGRLPDSFAGTQPVHEMNQTLTAALEQTSDQPIAAELQPFGALPATLGPDRSLLTYYTLQSLLFGPFFFFALIPLYFRFRSMRYEVDEEGITMSWGVLFRREISLTFGRIQDIHLSSNVVQRWLGLASIQIQTASGSATAEMTVEGLPQYEAVRDFFYARMRGASKAAPPNLPAPADLALSPAVMDELTDTLREIAMEVRLLRQAVRPPAVENSDA